MRGEFVDEDDFQEYREDDNNSSEGITSDDIKEIYDKGKDFKEKYDSWKESEDARNAVESKRNVQMAREASLQSGGTATANGAATSGTAADGTAASGTAAGGAAAGGAAAGGAAAAIPVVGWVIAGISLLFVGAKAAKKEKEKRKNEGLEDKIKRHLPLIILISIIFCGGVLNLGIGYQVTTSDSVDRLDEYISCIEADEENQCQDLWEFEGETVEGKGKSLIMFSDNEYEDVAKDFANISIKYFEYGEGEDFKDYSELSENSGKREKELINELLSRAIANYLAIEAEAFSNIVWQKQYIKNGTVVTEDIPQNELEKVRSTSSSSGNIFKKLEQLFTFPSFDIIIPKKDIFGKVVVNVTKNETVTVDHIENTTDTTQGKTGVTYSESNYDVDFYYDLVYNYLPHWYEPYSIYLASGDVELANSILGIYQHSIRETYGKLPQLKVILFETSDVTEDINIVDTVGKSVTSTENGNTEKKINKTATTTIIKKITRHEPKVESGAAIDHVLFDLNQDLSSKVVGYTKNRPTQEQPNVTTTSQNKDDKGKVISTTVTNVNITTNGRYKYIKETMNLLNGDGTLPEPLTSPYYYHPDSETYRGLYSKKLAETNLYDDNEYINCRISYVYYLYVSGMIAEDAGTTWEDFNLDTISPAVEIVYKYYYNKQKSKNDTVSTSGTLKSESDGQYTTTTITEKPGTSNANLGYTNVYRSRKGVTYKEWKQNRGDYAKKTYSWGSGSGEFGSWGCPITAAAILLNAYGIDVDPYTLYEKTGAVNPAVAANIVLGGNKAVSAEYNKEKLKQLLKEGKPVSIHDWAFYPSWGHYMTILDISEDGTRVYLSTVNTAFDSRTDNGWISLSSLDIDRMYYIP